MHLTNNNMTSFKLILCLALSLTFSKSFSQYSVGMLKIGIGDIKINGQTAPTEVSQTLGNMDITIYSDGVVQKSEARMMMMNMVTMSDSRLDSIYTYMDMMGKKYKVAQARPSLTNSTENKDFKVEDYDIKEFPEDVKTILGYKCHRVDVNVSGYNKNLKEDTKMTMTLYVTNELNFDPSYVNQAGQSGINIKGTPLEFKVITTVSNSMHMEMTMLAKEYQKEVNPSDLLPPSGDYESRTMEELEQRMKK